MNLSTRIREIRKKHHLSQEQFAHKLGVTRQAVSKWELGDAVPDVDNIISISKAFNVTLDYLLLDELTDERIEYEEKKTKVKFNTNKGFIVLLLSSIGLIILPIMAKFIQFREFEVFGETYDDWRLYLNIAPLLYVKIILIIGVVLSIIYLLFTFFKESIKIFLNNIR